MDKDDHVRGYSGSPDWDSIRTLEELAGETSRRFYSGEATTLCDLPQPLLDRCWSRLRRDPASIPAATVLFNVLRAKLDAEQRLAVATPLKELLDLLDAPGSSLSRDIGQALREAPCVRQPLQRALARAGRSLDDLHRDPGSVLEELFPVETATPADQRLAGLVLAGLRGLLADMGDFALYTLFSSLSEAARFFLAEEPAQAESTLRWSLGRIDSALRQLPEEASSVLGSKFLNLAVMAGNRECFRLQADLLTHAKSLLPASGDAIAECLLMEGEEQERQGNLDAAFRCYEQGLACQPTDLRLRGVLQAQLAGWKMTLEGDPSRFEIDPDAARAYGFDPDVFPLLKRLQQDIGAHKQSSDVLPQLIRLTWSLLDRRIADGDAADRILSLHCEVLTMALSLDDAAKLPFSYSEAVAQADRHVEGALPGTVFNYQQIRESITRTLHEVAGPSEQLALADAVEQISNLPSAVERLHALHLVTTRIFKNQLNTSAFPLVVALDVATRSLDAARMEVPTAEAAIPIREGAEQLIGLLGLLVYRSCGMKLASANAGLWRARIDPKDSPGEQFAAVAALELLLRSSANWILGRYLEEPLCQSIKRLPPDEQAVFASLRQQLAELLNDPFFDAHGAAPVLADLRKLRALAQVASSRHRTPYPKEREQASPRSQVFVFNLLAGSQDGCMAGLASLDGSYALWSSRLWWQLAKEYVSLPKDRDLAAGLGAWHGRYAGNPFVKLSRVLERMPEEFCHHPEVEYCDLTGRELPLAWVADAEQGYAMSAGLRRAVHTLDRPHGVTFWGWTQESGRRRAFVLDDEKRRIELSHAPEIALEYPRPAPKPNLGFARSPAPLPYAHYERWSLEAICREAGCFWQAAYDESATRQALFTSESRVSVLHVATHGEVIAGAPECSHLLAASEGGSKSKISFIDIMSNDWSHLELVYLSACLTNTGDSRSGEGPLSLAWAFQAGGARAVIASRWKVEDEVAWAFADRFYRFWLWDSPQPSVAEAFRRALFRIRRIPKYQHPHQWGAFMLLQ